MGMAPGVYIKDATTSPARGNPTTIGTWFAVGSSERGPVDRAVTVRSLADFTTTFGGRVAASLLYDSVDTFFACGGATCVVSRVIGAAGAAAQKVLNDASAGASLTVKAANPGTWGNSLTVQVVAGSVGGTFVLVVAESGAEVERSGDLATTADAALWSAASRYVRATASGANDPAVAAAAALVGGVDDYAGAVTADYTAALARFTKQMGPGQVSAPGVTTAAVHSVVMDAAAAGNRVALLDQVDSATAATIIAAATSDKAHAQAWRSATFAQWAVVRGVTAGTTRTVPYSAVYAGAQARVDATIPTGGQPAAGNAGILPGFVYRATQAWSDQDRAALNDAGVIVAVDRNGTTKTYGAVGLGTGLWRQIHTARVRMRAQAELEAAAEGFVFRSIDGQGLLQAEFNAALRSRLLPMWTAGALYGATADDAFTVDTGNGVNTAATKAAGQLNASVEITLSPVGETVTINLTSRAIA